MLVRYPKVDDIRTVLLFRSINQFIQKTEKRLLKIYIYAHACRDRHTDLCSESEACLSWCLAYWCVRPFAHLWHGGFVCVRYSDVHPWNWGAQPGQEIMSLWSRGCGVSSSEEACASSCWAPAACPPGVFYVSAPPSLHHHVAPGLKASRWAGGKPIAQFCRPAV